MNDQRRNDNGANGRRPWLQRYMGLVTCLIGIFVVISGVSINTWARAQTALDLAKKNEDVLRLRTQAVASIPHFKDDLDSHIENFEDFRNEQRKVNVSMGEKLDYIITKVK